MKRRILAYLLLTFAGSWLLAWFVVTGDGVKKSPLSLPFLFMPGLVAILLCRRGERRETLGLRRPSLRSLLIGYLVPFAGALLTGGILIATGVDGLALRDFFAELVVGPLGYFALFLVLAVGEELGWRGFLQAELKDAGVRRYALVTGIVWSLWHYPLIFFGDYLDSPEKLTGAALFTLDLTFFAFFLARLRDRSTSVWPAVVAHASHNTWVMQTLPSLLTKGPRDHFLSGEAGLGAVIYYALFAIVVRG